MATKKKLLQAAAGAGGAALNVEDVFSTYLYTGNGSTQTITNGVDLSGEGGLVWAKARVTAFAGMLVDTERGGSNKLETSNTSAQASKATITGFTSTGFTVGNALETNYSGEPIASWTFRKAPKFFDVVTYTGDGTTSNAIAHSLGATPACIIIKPLNTASFNDWRVWHKDLSTQQYQLKLNTTDAEQLVGNFISQNDTTFTVGYTAANQSGINYVAYLFAHNNGDGEFGPTGDQDIIKCGSYTGNGTDQFIDLGFEPQWVMIKDATTGGTYRDWCIFDNMRKLDVSGSGNAPLMANLSDSEGGVYASSSYNLVQPTPTGMIVEGTSGPLAVGTNGDTYIYIAIRRGPMAVPESATDVFGMDTFGNAGSATPSFTSNFPVDMALWRTKNSTNNMNNAARLISGRYLRTNLTDAEATLTQATFDFMDGYYNIATGTDVNTFSWMWQRAPSFMDVVCYTGTGAARTVSHNLGVAPEMIWVKSRYQARDWEVYHSGIASDAETDYINLNQRYAAQDNANFWNDTKPTDSVFNLGISASVNNSSEDYIAYLFASLSGVSKIGSYTGNGTSQTIDCGFSSGARFILIKRSDQGSGIIAAGDWHVFDTERGVVAGNDPYLELNTTNAEVTSEDAVDPDNSGFIVNEVSGSNINTSGNTYIFYAIA